MVRCFPAVLLLAVTALADQGIPPRPNAADYQAHQGAANAVIAASVLSSDAVSKLFAPDIAHKYVVVEVSVYPANGQTVDLHPLDFSLTTGAELRSLPATPEEVVAIWHRRRPELPGGINVVGEAGIGYGTATNPATGQKEHSLGTYTGVGVDNRPQPVTNNSGPDPYTIQSKLERLALPEIGAAKTVAGYLYFPVLKRPKGAAFHLQYSTNGTNIDLALPPQSR